MKGYWVARCHITNGDEYSKYAALAGPIIESIKNKKKIRKREKKNKEREEKDKKK